MTLAQCQDSTPPAALPPATTFGQVAKGTEFSVTTTCGSLVLRKIEPILAANLPDYRPRFFVRGQHANPLAYNAMGRFGQRWEYFYLWHDCPVIPVRK